MKKMVFLIALGVGIFYPLTAKAEVPASIVGFRGFPGVAVFEDAEESYALGCSQLRNIWSSVPDVTARSKKLIYVK